MKLLIGIPTLDYMHFEFVQSLTNLIRRLNKDGVDYDIKYINGTLVYAARNKIVLHALEHDFTHVLWIDADMVFTENVVDDLLFCGKDFVSARFNARRKPFIPCQFKKLVPLECVEEYPHEAFRIAGCGFGCVLMTTEVLKDVQRHYGTCFLPMSGFGEDLAFCVRATEINIPIFCEPSAVVGHVGHIAIYPEDHERWKDEQYFTN